MTVPQSRHEVKQHAQRIVEYRAAREDDAEVPTDPVEALRQKHMRAIRKKMLRERGIDLKAEPFWIHDPLPNMGKVASKRLKQEQFDRLWFEGIHQNMIFVGASIPSPTARARATSQWKASRSSGLRARREASGAASSSSARREGP